MYEETRAAQAAVDERRGRLFTVSARTLDDRYGRLQVDRSSLPDDAFVVYDGYNDYCKEAHFHVYSSTYEPVPEGAEFPDGGPMKLL